MAFDAVVFPLIVESCTSAPEYNTTIIALGNGSEQRIGNWDDARLVYNAAMGVRSKKDLQTLIGFFRARKGRLRGFLVKDLIDFETLGAPIGTGDGARTVWQLTKTYGDSSNVDVRTITKPKSTTVQVYSGVTLLAETTNYTINYTTGVITFVVAPAVDVVLTWTGEFYVPCRFGEDRLPADQIYFDLVENKAAGHIPDIPLIEIRET